MSRETTFKWMYIVAQVAAIVIFVAFLWMLNEAKSERSRRIELEAEYSECRELWRKNVVMVADDLLLHYSHIRGNRLYFWHPDMTSVDSVLSCFVFPCPDSLLAVPPKDIIVTIPIDSSDIDTLGRSVLDTIIRDSSEVTDTIVFDSTVDTLGMKPVRKVDTIKLIYTFEVGADGKMKQINP